MEKKLTREIRDFALLKGTDIVGIGSMDRFDGAPKHMDPRYIFPDAKVMIGLGFRIPRGYLRGIEEGTHFYQYASMGYSSINEVYAPTVLRDLSCFIEDRGYEGVVFRNTGGLGIESDMDAESDARKITFSEPVSPDRPAPDVYFQFRIAAFICGMGEIGYSKMFLTPEFGPRQRFAFLLTDAPLVPDPIYDGPAICDRCMLCVKDCPGNAISGSQTVKVEVAGRKLEWGKLEAWQCFYAYMGGVKEINPFLPRDAYRDFPEGEKIMRGEKKLSPEEVHKIQEILRKCYASPGGYNNAMCAGRGCIRACMVHLEQKGVLKNKFKEPFRKRKPWRL